MIPTKGANVLNGVAATSGSNAWTVGYHSHGPRDATPLIEQWNGEAWHVRPSPDFNGELYGVAAVSARDAWAVGLSLRGGTIIEHWNGMAWHVQRSPILGGHLSAVAALSASDAWAVGSYNNGYGYRTLVEHWNGKAWNWARPPNAGGSASENQLSGVAVVSPTDVWVGGYYHHAHRWRTLIEHWNGKTWKVQKSPRFVGQVYGMAAAAGRDVWGVGEYAKVGHHPGGALVEHWNGKVWRVQPSPSHGGFGVLRGVAAVSSRNAWAVGFYDKAGTGKARTLVEHWNGKTWRQQPSPNPGGASDNQFCGAAAVSASDAWAVGDDANGRLIEKWNGTAWTPSKRRSRV